MRLVSNIPMVSAVEIEQVDRFSVNDVLYWYDTIDQQYVEKNFFANKGYPGHIINDSYTFFRPDWPSKIWCADLWLAEELQNFSHLDSIPVRTDYTVNFVINKKQINRFLVLKLCEFFNLEKIYTWSGKGKNFDMSPIIKEWDELDHPFDDTLKSFLLSPCVTDPHWVGQRLDEDDVSIKNYGSTLESWLSGIDQVVSRSAISLITESQKFEKAIHFSEKTAYAILGQTFPIWVGGYRQADEWSKMGFDVFEDVIDHSYQYRHTLIERCFYAFSDNLHILKNKHLASELRRHHESRLKSNFDLLKQNQVKVATFREINSWHEPIRSFAKQIIANVFPPLIIDNDMSI